MNFLIKYKKLSPLVSYYLVIFECFISYGFYDEFPTNLVIFKMSLVKFKCDPIYKDHHNTDIVILM